MEPRKIILASAYYPPHVGGQEVVVRNLASALASRGLDVEVLTSAIGSVSGVQVEDGVRVTRLKAAQFAHTAVIWRLLPRLLATADRKALVHVHTGQLFVPEAVWLASKIAGFPYILHFHAALVSSGPAGVLLPAYKKLLLRRVIRDASATIVLTEDLKNDLARHATASVTVMSNGITDDFYRIQRTGSGNGRLLFVGRLSPHKNVAKLLRAVKDVDPDLGLDIVGDGECGNRWRELTVVLGLSGVRFHGQLTRDQIKDFYATCDGLILPSTQEQQPVVLLEAMACGVPVISTGVHSLAAVVSEAGILVDPSVRGLAAGLRRFRSLTAEDRLLLSAKSRVAAQGFSLGRMVQSCVELYETVPGR